MKRGEIYLVSVDPNQPTGKKRPVVVVSRTEINAVIEKVYLSRHPIGQLDDAQMTRLLQAIRFAIGDD